MDLADRNLQLAHVIPDRAGELATLIVELALLGDVLEIERVGVGLVAMGRAVAEDDDVTAAAHGRHPFGLRLRGRACGQRPEQRQDAQRYQPNNLLHHGRLL